MKVHELQTRPFAHAALGGGDLSARTHARESTHQQGRGQFAEALALVMLIRANVFAILASRLYRHSVFALKNLAPHANTTACVPAT